MAAHTDAVSKLAGGGVGGGGSGGGVVSAMGSAAMHGGFAAASLLGRGISSAREAVRQHKDNGGVAVAVPPALRPPAARGVSGHEAEAMAAEGGGDGGADGLVIELGLAPPAELLPVRAAAVPAAVPRDARTEIARHIPAHAVGVAMIAQLSADATRRASRSGCSCGTRATRTRRASSPPRSR